MRGGDVCWVHGYVGNVPKDSDPPARAWLLLPANGGWCRTCIPCALRCLSEPVPAVADIFPN